MPKHNKSPLVKSDIFVSIVTVVASDAKHIHKWVEKATQLLHENYTNYELIIIDNGMDDASAAKLAGLLDSIACVRVIRLSQSITYDTALFAGIDSAIGEYVCTLDAGYDPLDAIPKIVSLCVKKTVIQGVSSLEPDTDMFTEISRRIYYWYIKKYLLIDIPTNATNLACYNRTVVNAMTRAGRSHKHVRYLVRLLGFRPTLYLYEPKLGVSKNHRIRTGVIDALEIAVNYSSHPLRFVTWLGVIAGAVNLLFALYVVTLNILNADLMEGWTTTSLQSSAMFFIIFVIMVILAEYIGRILVETRRDSYFVVDEKSSQVSLADEKRVNIEK